MTAASKSIFGEAFAARLVQKFVPRSIVAVVISLVVRIEARTGAGLAGNSIRIEETRMIIK